MSRKGSPRVLRGGSNDRPRSETWCRSFIRESSLARADPTDLIARFVAGYAIDETLVGSAPSGFRLVILTNFLATSDRLTTAATRAIRRCDSGNEKSPGFPEDFYWYPLEDSNL
jgi:hypothetical protein